MADTIVREPTNPPKPRTAQASSNSNGGGSDSFDPVADSIDTILDLHQRAERRAGLHQRAVERGTATLGRPVALYVIFTAAVIWMVVNTIAPSMGWRQVDPPPFAWLQGACTLSALVIAMLVLITQNRQGRLQERRMQLDLQINILNEQKAGKIIELIEELRRDMPSVRDRHDPEAETLTQSADPRAMIEALEVRMDEDELQSGKDADAGRID